MRGPTVPVPTSPDDELVLITDFTQLPAEAEAELSNGKGDDDE